MGDDDGDVAAVRRGPAGKLGADFIAAMADLRVGGAAGTGRKRHIGRMNGDRARVRVAVGAGVALRAAMADLGIGFVARAAIEQDVAARADIDGAGFVAGSPLSTIADLGIFVGARTALQDDIAGGVDIDRACRRAVIADLGVAVGGLQRDRGGSKRGGAVQAADRDIARRAAAADHDVAAIVAVDARGGELRRGDRRAVPAGDGG